MNILNDPNMWVICGLVFVLGLLIGIFLAAGGRRKWRSRYKEEAARRQAIEAEHERHRKDWEERNSVRDAPAAERRDPADEPRI